MNSLGERIKKLREQKNLTQTELSEILGMKTYTTVSKWESGDNFPKGKDLKKLAELFHVSSDYLLGLSNEQTQPKIAVIYQQLNNQNQHEVYSLAEKKLAEQQAAKVVVFKQPLPEDHTIAAHMDDDVTEEELDEIKAFIRNIKKREKK